MDAADGEDDAPFDLVAAVGRNRERLEQRFVTAAAGGSLWLAECRDLFDAHDADAGVYFVDCLDDAAVDEVAARCGSGNAADRLLGVYDLRRPLAEQGGGLSRSDWAARRVEKRHAEPEVSPPHK